MTRRLNVNRVIWIMAVVVIGLGALSAWAVMQGARFGGDTISPAQRAQVQIRSQMGQGAEVRYIEAGVGSTVCGYAGQRGQALSVAFVSRPNRIQTADDALPGEYRQARERFCPGFLQPPPRVP